MTKKFVKFNNILVLIAILLASGCAYDRKTIDQPAKDVFIPGFSSSMGAEGDRYEIGVFHYAVTLLNQGNDIVFITSILPVLNESFAERLIAADPTQEINQTLPPGASLEIEGELRFDFEGLSKQDIENMGTVISLFKLYREEHLSIPGNE